MTPSALARLVCVSCVVGACLVSERADAWVQGYQPFPDGEATVVLHRFCQPQDCGSLTEQEWQTMIQAALAEWNAADADFVFRTRPVRPTDDPCHLPGEVAVIVVTDSSQLCPGDGPLQSDDGFTGRTEFNPGNRARVYIKVDQNSPPNAYFFIVPLFLRHEFGHVVGLGHPDEDGQQVGAVMNSNTAPYDGLQPDDIAGIQALYGERGPVVGFLENPAPQSFQSGIGVISGWVCEADEIIIEINGQRQRAAYGTERGDTEPACGDTDNGFGLLFNWNHLAEDTHQVIVFVDGVELGRATFIVTTLGEEFLLDAPQTVYCLDDFPAPQERVCLQWSQPLQNFVLHP